VVADEFCKGVEALAHVAWFQCYVNFETSVEGEHGGGIRRVDGGVRRPAGVGRVT
jgi:hypothetical protein